MERGRITPHGQSVMSSSSVPWTCQVIHAEIADDDLVLDVVALEPSPTTVAIPAGTLFTMQVRLRRQAGDPIEGFAAWAARTDVVTIVAGQSGRATWVCLEDAHSQLVFELH